MLYIKDKYCVYLHVFPNWKKYIGCTSLPVKIRWDGGLGYTNLSKIFPDILKFGWGNIKHYVLCEGLDKDTAFATEAYLIQKWKTYRPSCGYNTTVNLTVIPEGFVPPSIKKRRIQDDKSAAVDERYGKRVKSSGWQSYKCKAVRLVETGEVYPSATVAARAVAVPPSYIARAASAHGGSCGVCEVCMEESGIHMFAPAHWEYININTEEKG